MQENKHTVIIEQRKTLSVSAVESVVAFSEVKIVLALMGGGKVNVVGSGLKITGFSKASGSFTAEGTVTGITYGGKGFAAKIFK
ncbi:MAG: YabP/YqfC family sporulation protein [Clostridia bacterium]|nr:YabP/YqfC family sporulation protein [Clostridia bacterium]